MSSLYQHIIKASSLIYICHGGGHTEGINRPAIVGAVTIQVLIAPFMSYEYLIHCNSVSFNSVSFNSVSFNSV